MAISPVYSPDEMRRVGGGRGGGGDDFAGLGGSFAGPGSEFVGAYLQNRIKGMNRATVSPRVNQMRVMASPEFALAKTLGISTPYNSGGSQVDIQGARQRMNSPSSMEREAGQAQLDKFQQRAAGAPRNPVMSAAGLASAGDAIGADDSYSGPVPSQSGFDEIQKRFGRPQEKINPVSTTPTPVAPSAPTPTIPASGDQTAAPISPQEARDATKAPIGAELPATSGEPSGNTKLYDLPVTPTRETTKGPRLETRGPQATGGAGTFEGGQQARKDADQRLANSLSDSAMQERAKAGGRYVGPAPTYNQKGIDEANDYRDNAQKNWDADPRGPTGIPYDAEGKMAVAQARNQAQDDREKIKKDYNFQAERYYGQMDRNRAAFGNPYGPDGGETLKLMERQKAPELAPLGGYDEKYTVGARGGDPNARRGEPGYTEKEIVPVGPMTNKPAASKEEYDARMKRFAEEGERQKARNEQKSIEAYKEKQNQEKFPVKDKGKPTERGYGPIGRRVA